MVVEIGIIRPLRRDNGRCELECRSGCLQQPAHPSRAVEGGGYCRAPRVPIVGDVEVRGLVEPLGVSGGISDRRTWDQAALEIAIELAQMRECLRYAVARSKAAGEGEAASRQTDSRAELEGSLAG